MDILGKLGRTDRHEILGNRMTAYGTGLGGGSINYWDGLWTNNKHLHPYQMIAVYEGHDGQLALRDRRGRSLPIQRYYHRWQPDVVQSNFLTLDRVVVKERRAIWNDVYASHLELGNLLMEPVDLRLCHEAAREPGVAVASCRAECSTCGPIAGSSRTFTA